MGFETNSIFLKTLKILCATLKHLIETEYGPHGDEKRISVQFLS
jgi:hypothetical protein